MDKLNEILERNVSNEQKKQAGLPTNSAPIDTTNVVPIKKRAIGDVIQIDNVLYKLRKITNKDLILRQMSQEEVNTFKKKMEAIRKKNWEKMWLEKVATNPNVTYKNPEDKTPAGGYWYCMKHFKEKYNCEPRMYIDVYSLEKKDYCKVCLDQEEEALCKKRDEEQGVIVEVTPPPEIPPLPENNVVFLPTQGRKTEEKQNVHE